jgi:hypothetical protein
MSDTTILHHITALVDEEHRLRDASAAVNTDRLKQIETELDQCWDLLRQRRAKREFGEDPAEAHLRDPATVKQYIG